MFIQTETTPNPNSLKFLLENDILEEGSIEFSTINDCENSDLAKSLLQIDGIERVFFGFPVLPLNAGEMPTTGGLELKAL